MAVIGSLVAQLSLDAAAFVRDLNLAGDTLDKAGRRMASTGRNISTYISAPLAGFGALVIKTSAEFETSMNRLESVSGATGAELGKLREEAKKLGSQIEFGKFSAQDAAEGMTDLAQAGFKTNEIITAMPGLLQLATAAQMDLAASAETVSSILRGYNLEVDDLARVNDVLTKTSIETNAELNTLGEAMKFVGPVASAAGLSFEEVAAAIGKLSDAGIQGEMAGTALRGSITALLNPTDRAVSSLDLYGVEVTDATGKMHSLTEIIGQFEQGSAGLQGVFSMLAEQMGGIDGVAASFAENFAAAAAAMVEAGDEVKKTDFVAAATEAAESMGLVGDQAIGFAEAIERAWKAAGSEFTSGQQDLTDVTAVMSELFNEMATQGVRVGDLMEIFGQRAGPAMAALISQGGVALEGLTKTLENSGGTAAKVASTQLQGFGAAMEGLRSSFEGLQIAIGESGLLQFATEAVVGITKFVEALSSLDPATLKFASILAASVAAGGPLLLLLGGAAVAIGALLSPIGLVVAAIVGTSGLIGAIVAFREEIGASFIQAIDTSIAKFVYLKEQSLAAVEALVTGVEEWFGNRMQAAFDSVTAPIQATVEAFRGMYESVVGRSWVPDMIEGIQEWFGKLPAVMTDPTRQAVANTNKLFSELAVGSFDQTLAKAEVAGRAKAYDESNKQILQITKTFTDRRNQVIFQADQELAQKQEQAAEARERFELQKAEETFNQLGQIAEETVERGSRAIIAARDANEELTRSLRDQLSLQQLQLAGHDQESEAYRLHVALLEAKKKLGGSITAEQAAMIAQLEQQATALDAQNEAAAEMERLWENTADNIQGLFTDTFENILSGGVTDFDDLADEIQKIFIRLAAELATLELFAAFKGQAGALNTSLQQMFSQFGGAAASMQGFAAGTLQTPSGIPIPSVGPGAPLPPVRGFQFGPALAGAGLGIGIGTSVGSALGAGTGVSAGASAAGAIAGGALGALGGPAGIAIGAALGGSVGGILSGIFGGGGGGDSNFEAAVTKGALGSAAFTEGAAGVVGQIDEALLEVLTVRQTKLADRILADAKGVSVQFGEEGPSANDLSRLAAARVGPVAQGLGFNVGAIAGRGRTPERQVELLQEAIDLQRAIEDMTGAVTPFRRSIMDLRTSFEEAEVRAEEFGISTEGMGRALRQAEEQLIAGRRLERQELKLTLAAFTTGGSPAEALKAALLQIEIQFAALAEEAKALGVSLDVVKQSLRAARQEARQAARAAEQQRQLDKKSLNAQLNAMIAVNSGAGDLANALIQIDLQFESIKQQAKELGISLDKVNVAETSQKNQARQAAADIERQRALDATSLRLQMDMMIQAGRGASDLTLELMKIDLEFKAIQQEAKKLGVSLELVQQAETAQRNLAKRAAAEAEEQRKLNRAQLLLELEAMIKTGNGAAALELELLNIDIQFKAIEREAKELGVSLELVQQAETALRNEAKRAAAEAKQAAIAQIASLTGSRFSNELASLNNQFREARDLARQFGLSVDDLNRAQGEAIRALEKRQQAEIDALALSIVDPFKGIIDSLSGFSRDLERSLLNPAELFKRAQQDFEDISKRALAGDLEAIGQIEEAGRFLIDQAARFGASPGQVEATQKVLDVTQQLNANVVAAQKDAQQGIEGAVHHAERAIVDTLVELVVTGRDTVREVQKLQSELRQSRKA